MAIKRKVARKPAPRERWTVEKQAAFLAKLSETANVSASARAVGMSDQGVYKLRARSPEFRAAWAEALREGYARLELMLLERAMKGTRKAVWHGGAKVGSVTEYSDRLALTLLNAHYGTVHGTRASNPPPRDVAEVEKQVAAKLAEMKQRMSDQA